MSENDTLPPSPPQAPPPPASGEGSNDERTWGLLAHLSALSGFVVPFGSVLGPLIVWQVKKNEMPFVDDQGKEALNFQITLFLEVLVACLLMFVLIGFLLLPAVLLYGLVMTIIGGVQANNGVRYRYPFTLRLIT
jgi:uncharacterized Tic20 family protein